MSNKKKGQAQRNAAKQRKKENMILEKKAKKRNLKKNIIITVSIVLAISIAVTIGVLLANAYVNSGAKMRESIYAESKNFKVSGATYSFFIYETYNAFKEHYGTYVQTFGLDVTKSLKTQVFSVSDDGEKKTWFQYFETEADLYLDEILRLCEEAYKKGIALNEEELNACRVKSKEINPSEYGKGTNSEDIYQGMVLEMLAAKYKGMVCETINVSDDEINDYVTENNQKYIYGHYREVKFAYTDSNYDKITARIERLKNAESDEQFVNLLIGFYTLDGEEDPQSKAESTLVTKARNDIALDMDIVEMIFSGETGGIKVIEGADTFHVYYVTDVPSYDNSSTVSLRHILTNEANYGSVENARKWINKLYDMYKETDQSEESFKKLALQYSAEQSSMYSGGLYPDIKKGELISDMDAWAFDESRAKGDVTVIENSYGFHFLYYIGEGEEALKGDVKEILKEQKYTEYLENLEEMKISYRKEVLNSIYM